MLALFSFYGCCSDFDLQLFRFDIKIPVDFELSSVDGFRFPLR